MPTFQLKPSGKFDSGLQESLAGVPLVLMVPLFPLFSLVPLFLLVP